MRNGMNKDFSWNASAKEYVRVYERVRQLWSDPEPWPDRNIELPFPKMAIGAVEPNVRFKTLCAKQDTHPQEFIDAVEVFNLKSAFGP